MARFVHVFRTDRLVLDGRRARRNSAGVLMVPASVARTGVQEYRRADGSVVREYRSPDAVFAPSTLESLRGAPVTDGHPPEGVQPHTLTQLARGLVSDRDPARAEREGRSWVDTQLAITDPDVAARAERGELVELSLGYECRWDPTPGVSPEGERYDGRQVDIVVNHCALLPAGQARAGREARLRLDSNEDVRQDSGQGTPMSEPQKPIIKVRIDGVEVVEHSAEHFQLVQRRADAATADLAKAQADLTAERADHAKTKARADGLEVDLAKARAVDVSALVADELRFRASAQPLLDKAYSFDGKDRTQVKRDAIGAEACKRVDAQPEAQRAAYLDGAFEHALAAKASAGPSYQPPPGSAPRQDANSDHAALAAASAEMFKKGRS